MPHHPPTLGLILAGGRGLRLGGADKARLVVGGRTILGRAVEVLSPDCIAIAISANGDPTRFGSPSHPVLPDRDRGGAGPLAGLLAGLDHAAACHPEFAWMASVPGDAPFLPAGLVARLHAARGEAPAVIAASGGRTHPVVGLWPVAARNELRHMLDGGERRAGRWARHLGAAVVEWPDAPLDPFLNVNAPEDLAAARRLAEERLDATSPDAVAEADTQSGALSACGR